MKGNGLAEKNAENALEIAGLGEGKLGTYL